MLRAVAAASMITCITVLSLPGKVALQLDLAGEF